MLDAECPSCGAPAPESIPETERLRYAGDPPDRPVRRTKCRERGCGRIYTITAGAYQQAGRTAAQAMAMRLGAPGG